MGLSDTELDRKFHRRSVLARLTGQTWAARRHDKFIDALGASLWFRPALWMIWLSVLAASLVWFDTWFEARVDEDDIPRLLRSHPDDARALLGAIVGAMLTVVSLAFSVVMVAVVQMSNAYSPRLLRSYLADAHNQHVLGILLGTFLFSLLVLRSIRQSGFSPTIAINVGVILAVVSTVALISFLHHVPQSMKVKSIIRMILEECEEELERAFPDRIGVECATIPSAEELSEEPLPFSAPHSGYVQIFDLQPLVAKERASPLVIRMHWRMGDFLLEGAPFASVWGDFDERDRQALNRACVFGSERTMRQDPRFGIEQLTDVALRALSTGINDPTTACGAINALTVLFGKLLAHDRVSPWRSDDRGQIRVEFPLTSFAELIEQSYLRILAHGCEDLQVVRGLIGACEQLAAIAEDPPHRIALGELLDTIARQAGEQIAIPQHRRTVAAELDRARATLSSV